MSVEFWRARDVKSARKARICDECGHPIEVGTAYRSCAYMNDGEFETQNVHVECQTFANFVMEHDDGRQFLRDSHPDDECCPEEIPERIHNYGPVSDSLRARLPEAWRKRVEERA